MKRNIIIGCIVATAVLLSASFASVVGSQHQQASLQESPSPLFTVRTHQAIQKQSTMGTSQFLGKGAAMDLFPLTSPTQQTIQAALRLASKNPALISRLLQNLDQFPYITKQLTQYGITPAQIQQYVTMIRDNPDFLEQCVLEMQTQNGLNNGPQPLGLSTSNTIACFIVAVFALLPITIVLTLLLLFFTARVLTCLNVNDCANNLAQNIWEQLIQGLTEP